MLGVIGALIVALVMVVRMSGGPDHRVTSGPAESTVATTVDTSASPVPQPTDPAPTTPELTATPAVPRPDVEDPEAALADPSFWVDAFPDLATLAAPWWVSQGTRITYYATAASVPQSYHRYVEDENGGWIDPTTGRKYRQEDIQSAAGHGYTEVNVSVLNESVAALDVRAYGLSDLALDSPVTTITWAGAVGLPAAGSDYWLHPDVLAQVDEVVSDSLKILRMPYAIGDEEFASIWFQSLGDRGNYTWVYDLDSGVLLHTASATEGPPITGPVAQGEGREGSTFLTQSTLVNVRDLALPWVGDSAPSWIGEVSRVDYEGTLTVNVTGSPIYLGMALTVDLQSFGTDWARYQFARTMWSDVTPSVTEYMERVDGPGQVGALWLPTDHLGSLSPGDLLDEDPVTRAVVTVEAVEATDSGFTVTIRESGPGEVSDLVYDGASGLLLASSYTNLLLYTQSDYQVTSWS
jgi:hypothetical protein